MIERVASTDPHACNDRIGNKTENMHGLAATIRVCDCLERKSAHGEKQVVASIDHFLGYGVADRNIAVSVELIDDDGFAFHKSVAGQGVDGAASALIQ